MSQTIWDINREFWRLNKEGVKMAYRLVTYRNRKKNLRKAAQGGKLYQVFVEKDAVVIPSRYNKFFDYLHHMYRNKKDDKWFTMEFHGSSYGIRTFVWLPEGIEKEQLQSAVHNIHPYAEMVEVEKVKIRKNDQKDEKLVKFLRSDYVDVEKLNKRITLGATLTLGRHFLMNLAMTNGDSPLTGDIIEALCNAMSGIRDHEEIGVQFVIRPVYTERLQKIMWAWYNEYQKSGLYPRKRIQYPYTRFSPYMEYPKEVLQAFKHAAMGTLGGQDFTKPKTAKNALEQKVTSNALFDVMIRIYVTDTKFETAKKRLDSLSSAFSAANEKNYLRSFHRYSTPKSKWLKHLHLNTRENFLKDYKERRIHTLPIGSYLCSSELTTICHFPHRYVHNVVRLNAKKLPAPSGVYKYNSIEEAWREKAIVFGVSNYRGVRKYLAFKDIRMLMQHCYGVGGTGSGKSYWLSFIALQLATVAKIGFTFFDVKGDVADTIIAHIPKSDWDRIVYIDLQEMYRFIPINILKQNKNESVYNIATTIVDSFLQVFGEQAIQARSQNVLRNAVIAVASTDPKGTLLEVYRLLTDEGYLHQTISRMHNIEGYEYPDVLAFWEGYLGMNVSSRKTEASAIINKLAMITQNERPRYTFSQPENALNWREMMDQKKIVIVNFGMDKNVDLILSFFGTIFTRLIRQAAFSRGDIPESQRVPHVFFIDEFQRFIDRPDDIETILELARSYGLGLVMAHQSVAQIAKSHSNLLKLITDNTFSQFCLLVGDGSGPDIAKILSTSTTSIAADDLKGLEEFTGYARFKKLSPEPFTFESLDMTEYFESASMEEVKKWKDAYKDAHYTHINKLKNEINERYGKAQEYLRRIMEEQQKEQQQKEEEKAMKKNPTLALENEVKKKKRMKNTGVVVIQGGANDVEEK